MFWSELPLKKKLLYAAGIGTLLLPGCRPGVPNAADNLFLKCQANPSLPSSEEYVLPVGERVAVSARYVTVQQPGVINIDTDGLQLDGAKYIVSGSGAFVGNKYVVEAVRVDDKFTRVTVTENCPDPTKVPAAQ